MGIQQRVDRRILAECDGDLRLRTEVYNMTDPQLVIKLGLRDLSKRSFVAEPRKQREVL